MSSVMHFGVKVQEGKKGLKISRTKYSAINTLNSYYSKFENLAKQNAYENNEYKRYTEEWCEEYKTEILKNYDLNMKFYSLLDRDRFNREINKFSSKHRRFKQVDVISEYSGISGYYMMILDEYCQAYVGTTDDICKRVRQHWTNSKYFDRLLFPMYDVDNSRLSIDSFRALDTTRLYVYPTKKTYENENKYINGFSDEFVGNRLAGGKITGGLLQAISMMKSRNLK